LIERALPEGKREHEESKLENKSAGLQGQQGQAGRLGTIPDCSRPEKKSLGAAGKPVKPSFRSLPLFLERTLTLVRPMSFSRQFPSRHLPAQPDAARGAAPSLRSVRWTHHFLLAFPSLIGELFLRLLSPLDPQLLCLSVHSRLRSSRPLLIVLLFAGSPSTVSSFSPELPAARVFSRQ
jgi:hypothetical protein